MAIEHSFRFDLIACESGLLRVLAAERAPEAECDARRRYCSEADVAERAGDTDAIGDEAADERVPPLRVHLGTPMGHLRHESDARTAASLIAFGVASSSCA